MQNETADKLATDVVLHDAPLMSEMPFGQMPISVGGEDQLRRDNAILRDELAMMRSRAHRQDQKLDQLEKERAEAAALQRDFLPHKFPPSDFATFEAVFVPMDTVSGDLYHVVRLDEGHIAMWIIDATGHGAAAGTLAACVQRSLSRMVAGDSEISAWDPAAVLLQLNHEIFDMDLTECQFVACVYAVLHERTGLLRWSRGGGCHPVVVRNNDKSESLVAPGPLVGMTDQAVFETSEVQLISGETVLFYSDGLESAVVPNISHTADEHSVVHWLTSHNANHETPIVEQLNHQVRRSRSSVHADDVAIVALHV